MTRPIIVREACGTLTGLDLHKKRGEESCFECRRAMAAYQRERRARAKRLAVLAEAVNKRVDNRVRITERLSDA